MASVSGEKTSTRRSRGRPRTSHRAPLDSATMDNVHTSPIQTAPDLDDSMYAMDDAPTNDLYGFGALVSPILSLPFARTNQMELKFKANLVGEKIHNPAIYLCDQCNLPILIYGRMVCVFAKSFWLMIDTFLSICLQIPCKHVFCYACASKADKACLRCSDEIFKIEKCNLGTVFMCRTDSCKRTYLSQRDLEAHIKHRHVRKADLSQRM